MTNQSPLPSPPVGGKGLGRGGPASSSSPSRIKAVTDSADQASESPRSGLRAWVIPALLGVVVLLLLLSLALGSVRIPLREVVTILSGGESSRATWETIVWQLRLPRALTALLAGASLAVAGLQMQTLFRNPLAGPFVLGINAGASLGVAIVLLTVGVGSATLLAGLGLLRELGVVAAATLGAALVLFLVMLVARRVETMTLLILGLMFGYATSALTSVLLYFSVAERIQAYIAWSFGSFAGVSWSQLSVLAPVVLAGLGIAWLAAKPLNALLLGEAYARTLGLTTGRARFWILVSASLLAGTITAFCGPIGFIGVAVPHLCRSLLIRRTIGSWSRRPSCWAAPWRSRRT